MWIIPHHISGSSSYGSHLHVHSPLRNEILFSPYLPSKNNNIKAAPSVLPSLSTYFERTVNRIKSRQSPKEKNSDNGTNTFNPGRQHE